MVTVEYKQLKSVDFDFEKCEDGFEYIENLIKMETSNCVNALAEFNKAFKNLSYVGETNEAQCKVFEIYLRVLTAITDNYKKTGNYIFEKPSKTLLKNINKLKLQFHFVLEKFADLGLKDGDYLNGVNMFQKHYQLLELLIDVLEIC